MAGSRYDIFLMTAANGSADAKEVQKAVGIDRDIQFNQEVQILMVNKLIDRVGNNLVYPEKSDKAQFLFDILSFALTYDINYNNYISSPMMMFLEQTYNQNSFMYSSVEQADAQKTSNISILKKNGFLLIYDESPFRAKVIKNSFIDLILQLNNRQVLKENKKIKPVQPESIIMEEMMKRQMSSKYGGMMSMNQIHEVKYITEDMPDKGIFLSLSPLQQQIKKTLAEKNPESLNATFQDNFDKARALMKTKVASGTPLSVDLLMEYHKVLMNDPSIGGILRTVPVTVAGNPSFKICDHRKIRQTLDKMIDKYTKDSRKFKGLPDVIKFAAYLHNELQHTHPFVDGNSRLTRLVVEHFCSQNRLPNYSVPTAYISRYTQLTKGARNRDDNKLFELFKEIFLFIIKNPSND